jgi:ligand-binding sensor domain-containing protein
VTLFSLKGNLMRKTGIFQNFECFAGILVCLIALLSCERTNYDLLDPASAGTWTHYDTSNGLPGNTVSGIKLDKDGNLWMTFSGQGAAELTANGTWTTFKTSNSAILSNAATCLAQTASGTIIFGTSNGVSLLTGTSSWSSYIDMTATMTVTAIKVASNGAIWVGTSDQGFYVNRGSGFVKTFFNLFQNVNAIEEDNSGNIWIGTNSGLIKWDGSTYAFQPAITGSPLPNIKISCIRQDGNKRLWIGTRGGKQVAWVDKNGLHGMSLLNGRDSCIINDIFQDRRGDIWFATANDGVVCYNGIIPKSYRISDGLQEDKVRSIGEDKDGNLWFGLESKGAVKYTLPLN